MLFNKGVMENTYFYEALCKINPKIEPPTNASNQFELFDYFTTQDCTLKKARFLQKTKSQQYNKENTDCIYTNRTFTCPKCKKNETFRTNKQTRGGDEGETIAFFCKFCKIPFKV